MDDLESNDRGWRNFSLSPETLSETQALQWWPELGIGYYPVLESAKPYDQEYFDRYARQADTDIGRALMQFRCEFVAKHWDGPVLDVGVGSGAFLEARSKDPRVFADKGFDVNPAGREWLSQRGLFSYIFERDAMCFWDSLEHMKCLDIFRAINKWAFVSIPIFRDVAHVMQSKHYRPTEHHWYFTTGGLIRVFEHACFECVEVSDGETKLGREDILTFAFRRKA